MIPTKTVPQGITAMINFMADADAAANEEVMIARDVIRLTK